MFGRIMGRKEERREKKKKKKKEKKKKKKTSVDERRGVFLYGSCVRHRGMEKCFAFGGFPTPRSARRMGIEQV